MITSQETLSAYKSPLNLTPVCESEQPDILIVDDEASVRTLFAECLSEHYNCYQSATVLEAFTQLTTRDFALVITDVLMPGLSGVELLRKVIDSHPETAVIMVSGVDQPKRALDAIRLGAFDYLIKPCDLDVLEMTVERAMQQRSLRLEAGRYKAELEERVNELACQKKELERLQSQIVHSKKMASLGQLAAGVAHELNNPAGFIYGNMDLLRGYLDELKQLLIFYDDAKLPSEVAERIRELKAEINYQHTFDDLASIIIDCQEGSKRIRDIAQNLRVFTRLDEAEFQKTDIHVGIDSTIRLLSSYFTSDNITLIREYGDVPLIDAFPGQLNQVWMNLLVNGAQAVCTQGGQVSVQSRTVEKQVQVTIRDTGTGIPANLLDKIFDPFFTTKDVGEGTGLGLSICFSIIERHGGTIRVESEVGSGTTYTVTLPITNNLSSEQS